ncbi:scavenger receptor cysteine-rich type 1 protein M160 isoform X2 [Silurus meridionalis]|uniref:scavenger receptor cysteine-rich type 1 protein M160 isoform X2 n=1 Tax=Silurus meridionalis TaxID=175797 RepID=UPI001EE9B92F|nr:scavenger receptor cysteine-rich type 1 protein M160 isoform X2 [Silurus meridionalis]
MLLLLIYIQLTAIQAQDYRIALRGSSHPCEGHVELYYQNQWGLVGHHGWKSANGEVVCRSLGCGKHVKSGVLYHKFNGSLISNFWLDEINCTGNEQNLWNCASNGWNITHCRNYVSVVCSGNISLSLNLHGVTGECAGEVKFTTPSDVFVCEEHWGYEGVRLHGGANVCEGTLDKKKYSTEENWKEESCQGFNKSELDKMCAKMKCGKAAAVNPCINTTLNCTDRVKVELRNEKRPLMCYGDVYFNVNGAHQAMCVDNNVSFEKAGEVVCRELKCGSLLSVSLNTQLMDSMISHVECDGQEKSLWECIYKSDANRPCKTINVICSGSLDMRLSYGLDKCAGQLEIKHKDSWWKMNSEGWTKQNSDMVCQYLDCGDSVDNKKHNFVKSKLSALDWKLTCSGSNISQCRMQYQGFKGDVIIICKKYELWFLHGNSSCEGRVKSESGEYLQNITDEKAKEVCTWNHCVPSTNKDIFTNPLDCTAKPNSTFNCSEPQYAHVKCSGSREVRLQNKCHGKVLVCSNDKCGVCEDTWTKEQSRMLCKMLGCGDVINEQYSEKKTGDGVTIASVHCSESAQNFNQCNFVQLKDTTLCQNAAYVACTGSVSVVMEDPRDKCAGNLKLFYAGVWQSVCAKGIDTKTQNAMCTMLGCGNAVSFDEGLNSTLKSKGVTGVTCSDGNISNCDFSKSAVQQCQVGFLSCTGWRRLLLTSTKEACTGEVYLQNNEQIYAVSSDGWSDRESDQLCKYLNCGNFNNSMIKEQQVYPYWKKSYNCTENQRSIWDCEKEKAPTGNHHLHISCTDKPQVTLKGNCSGEVRLKNGPMCYKSHQTEHVFHELCQQLGCSMFFRAWSTKSQGNARYVSCTGKENNLWQCNSWEDKCEDVVSLACTKAITWRFSEVCGGKLQVNYRGNWEPVCPVDIYSADRLCQKTDCGNLVEKQGLDVKTNENVDVMMQCKHEHTLLMHCFKPVLKPCTMQAEIKCEKYIPLANPPDMGLIVGIVVGLLLVLLAAIILFRKRKTILAVLRSKFSPAEDSDEEYSENEMQSFAEQKGAFETDDYDDIDATMNSIEDNNSQAISSDHDEENRSTSSGSSGTEYDDVDEETAKPPASSSPSNPLLPPRPDNLLDVVTFEAEVEPQEDYDDVILHQDVIREQGDSCEVPGPSSNPPLLLSNAEAQPQEDE